MAVSSNKKKKKKNNQNKSFNELIEDSKQTNNSSKNKTSFQSIALDNELIEKVKTRKNNSNNKNIVKKNNTVKNTSNNNKVSQKKDNVNNKKNKVTDKTVILKVEKKVVKKEENILKEKPKVTKKEVKVVFDKKTDDNVFDIPKDLDKEKVLKEDKVEVKEKPKAVKKDVKVVFDKKSDDDVFDKDKVIKEEIPKEDKVEEKKKNNKFIIFLILGVSLLAGIYLMFPKIILDGDKEVTIGYNDKYMEPGYQGYALFKDKTSDVVVTGEVDNKVGEYEIDYYLDYGIVKVKKTRVVKVVDNEPPIIGEVDDEIKVCPNKTEYDVNYVASDGYDGDITDKVVKTVSDDKITLTVTDSSKNTTTKEIKVIKVDDESPKITLKGYQTLYLNIASKYVEAGYTAVDNCDGDISDKVSVSGTVSNKVGTYNITYSVTDSAGNKSEVIRTVIVKNYYLYNSGTIGNGTIYLTFDDGPSYGTTNVILDILKEEGVKATFFVTCNGPDALIKRMYDEGHTVALHTATHNYSYIYSSVNNYFEDLNRVSARVKNITGEESKIIRFPGGSSNTISRNYKTGIMTELTGLVLEKGYRYFDWNVDSNDAGGARSSNEVYNNVIYNLSFSRSNVVLMHDIKTTTRDALRNIIYYARSHGYTFDKLTMDTYMIRHGVNN